MGPSRTSRSERDERAGSTGETDDLGTQLEDLIAHVMRCERWARLDDRIALAVEVEDRRRRRPEAGR
jgi:hypothetical protein